MKLKPHVSRHLIYPLIYITCLTCIICAHPHALLAMPMAGQAPEEEVVEIVTEEVAAPEVQAPTHTTAPMGTPTSTPPEQHAQTPEIATAQIDPAAQPTQMSGPDIIELEKTKPLIEQQNPKTMELFSQAEALCNKIQDVTKNIESMKENLNKQYNQIIEEKKLDQLIESANYKRGILQQASDKK
ncbi:MAG: hypothetical protein ABH827_02455 [bacterium]